MNFHCTFQILGTLPGDPITRETKRGTKMTKFTLMSHGRVFINGIWKSKTMFFPITCFGRLAEIADKYQQKGSVSFVTGFIDQYKKNTIDGLSQQLSFVAERIVFITSPESASFKHQGLTEEEMEEIHDPFEGLSESPVRFLDEEANDINGKDNSDGNT